jgi:hypothetical protein
VDLPDVQRQGQRDDLVAEALMASHATRVVDLTPHIDRRALAAQADAELVEAILFTHEAEHSNVWITSCANPICRKYVARGAVAS